MLLDIIHKINLKLKLVKKSKRRAIIENYKSRKAYLAGGIAMKPQYQKSKIKLLIQKNELRRDFVLILMDRIHIQRVNFFRFCKEGRAKIILNIGIIL